MRRRSREGRRSGRRGPALLRDRSSPAHVTFEELLFDLVYAFAVTQLSHRLLHHLDPAGAVETLILWFAVWLGWQYTCWVTNWFDPEAPRIRRLLFAVMLAGLVMSAALPEAFGERAFAFALAYVAMQCGRTAYIVLELDGKNALSANYRRMLGWLAVAACLWLAGAWAGGGARVVFWAAAVLCEYVSPMIGFALPGMGRSRTSDWTVEGGHIAERCQAFVLVALGETLVATGGALSETPRWDLVTVSAVPATFLGTLALWWLYFGTSGKDATEAIAHSGDPGRMSAYFHYVHAVLIGGIIVNAVGDDLVMAHPLEIPGRAGAFVLAAGPAIYLFGSALYKRAVYGRVPASHLAGIAALALVPPLAARVDLLTSGWLTTGVMLAVGLWEGRIRRA